MTARIGIIGGSGLDDPDILSDAHDQTIETPYGAPSSPLRLGTIAGCEVALLARHGRRHTIPPSQINSRANLRALRDVGCTHVLASAACGSLRATFDRGELVIPDQFIDFTRHRPVTFFDAFESGIENARHTPMADPFDAGMRRLLVETGRRLGLPIHDGGTILTIEGPRFSSRAESEMFRIWGADLVNMTVAPEAILANEIGLPYAVVAMVTDFDCWKTDEPPLCIDDIIKIFQANIERITRLLTDSLAAIGKSGSG